jgi:hypothetical protein
MISIGKMDYELRRLTALVGNPPVLVYCSMAQLEHWRDEIYSIESRAARKAVVDSVAGAPLKVMEVEHPLICFEVKDDKASASLPSLR